MSPWIVAAAIVGTLVAAMALDALLAALIREVSELTRRRRARHRRRVRRRSGRSLTSRLSGMTVGQDTVDRLTADVARRRNTEERTP